MVVYFYFNYQSKETQTAIQIIKIIIKQLISGVDIPENLESLYQKYTYESTTPAIRELLPVLESCSQPFSSRYAVFDALDECSNNHIDEILDLFVQLQKFGYRLLISGRPPMNACQTRLSTVTTLEILATDNDIKLYITKKLQNHKVKLPQIKTRCLELVKEVDGM
jgi:hypothetical protein